MRIVILFAKAGGGHESSAKALKTQMLKQNPKLTVEIVDILANSPQWQQKLFCQSYVFFTDKVPFVWSFLQILWKIDFLAKLTALPLKFQIKQTLQEILNSRPDKIICTYFLVDNWLNELQKELQNSTKNQQNSQISKTNFQQNKLINEAKNENLPNSKNSQNLKLSEIQTNNSKQIQIKLENKIEQNIEKKIPIWTVVTDIFSPHSVWFTGKNCNYLVFSNRAKKVCQNRGVSADKIVEFGVFFGEKFEKIGTKLEIENWKNQFLTKNSKQNLEVQNKTENSHSFSQKQDISKQIPTLLVVGGGESMPGGTAILENLLNLEINFNLIFVCGRNEKLRENCEKIVQNWQNQQKDISKINSKIPKFNEQKYHKNIQILGFTTNLYELINIADLVVCKAGPATVLELISQQKPFLISHFIWEQEIGNRDFAVSGGVAIFEKNTRKLAQKVQELFENKSKLDNLTQNYQNLRIQNDLANITKFLIET